jgi:hypothetical protein
MSGTFFRKDNLEDRLNETVMDTQLPNLVSNEAPTLKEFYIEIGKDIHSDFYASAFGKKWNNLYERLNIDEYIDLIGIDNMYSKIGVWGNKILGEFDWQQFTEYGATPLASMGAFTVGSLLCYVTNLK